MAEAKRRKRQSSQETQRTIDGNKLLLGAAALLLVVGVGLLAFWVAGRGGPAPAARSAVQSQPQAQRAPRPQVVAPQAEVQPQRESPSTGSSGARSKGEPAPDFSVPTLDGGTFRLADQRGKPTVIFFMAYWCPTCVPEARALAKLHKEYGDKVSILALDVDPSSSPEALQQFLTWTGNPDYTFGFDRDNSVLQKYKVRSLDATVIIDADGNIVYRDSYPTSYEKLKAELEKVVS